MAANPTPTNDAKLYARCHDLVQGCSALEEEIGIKQNTAAVMQAALDAATTAQAAVGRLKSERGQRRADLRRVDRECELVLGRVRLRLAAIFGLNHNVQWEAAGFPDRSTMVPEVFALRLTLLKSLAAYFTMNPANESVDMGATAAICHAAHEALSDARSAVNHNKSRLRAAVQDKNLAMAMLRRRMRGLILELGLLLADDDPRWRRFGLNRPASETMPSPVEQVTLTAIGQGKVEVQWPAAPHATRYRVQKREMGAQAFDAVDTVHDTSLLLRDLEPGQFIEVRVIAANAMDETSPSPATAVAVH